jgi:hypothetical protein
MIQFPAISSRQIRPSNELLTFRLTFPFGFRVRYTFPQIRFTDGAGCRIRFGGRGSRFPAG